MFFCLCFLKPFFFTHSTKNKKLLFIYGLWGAEHDPKCFHALSYLTLLRTFRRVLFYPLRQAHRCRDWLLVSLWLIGVWHQSWALCWLSSSCSSPTWEVFVLITSLPKLVTLLFPQQLMVKGISLTTQCHLWISSILSLGCFFEVQNFRTCWDRICILNTFPRWFVCSPILESPKFAGLVHLQKKLLTNRIFSVWGGMLCLSACKSWHVTRWASSKSCKNLQTSQYFESWFYLVTHTLVNTTLYCTQVK